MGFGKTVLKSKSQFFLVAMIQVLQPYTVKAFFDYPWLPGELEALQWANRAEPRLRFLVILVGYGRL